MFTKMAASFSDSHKAEEFLHKLNQIKDNNVFKSLERLLDEQDFTIGQALKVCCLLIQLLLVFTLCLKYSLSAIYLSVV